MRNILKSIRDKATVLFGFIVLAPFFPIFYLRGNKIKDWRLKGFLTIAYGLFWYVVVLAIFSGSLQPSDIFDEFENQISVVGMYINAILEELLAAGTVMASGFVGEYAHDVFHNKLKFEKRVSLVGGVIIFVLVCVVLINGLNTTFGLGIGKS